MSDAHNDSKSNQSGFEWSSPEQASAPEWVQPEKRGGVHLLSREDWLSQIPVPEDRSKILPPVEPVNFGRRSGKPFTPGQPYGRRASDLPTPDAITYFEEIPAEERPYIVPREEEAPKNKRSLIALVSTGAVAAVFAVGLFLGGLSDSGTEPSPSDGTAIDVGRVSADLTQARQDLAVLRNERDALATTITDLESQVADLEEQLASAGTETSYEIRADNTWTAVQAIVARQAFEQCVNDLNAASALAPGSAAHNQAASTAAASCANARAENDRLNNLVGEQHAANGLTAEEVQAVVEAVNSGG